MADEATTTAEVKPAESAPTKDESTVSGDVKSVEEPKVEPKTVPLAEVTELRKQLRTFQEEKAQAEKQKLEEQGKWEELAKAAEAKATAAEQRVKGALIDNRVIAAANTLGIVDSEAALALMNRSGIDVSEDGTVTGVDEALKQLVENKPYLVAKDSATRIGSGSNPADTGNQSPTANAFKLSQIQDPKFYQEHRTDILKAMKLNQVIDDTK